MANGVKIHVSPFFVYPTTSIKNCWWWLRQLLFWEWGGRTISPHPHAHSTTVDFTMARKTTAITPGDGALSTTCYLHCWFVPHDGLFTSMTLLLLTHFQFPVLSCGQIPTSQTDFGLLWSYFHVIVAVFSVIEV